MEALKDTVKRAQKAREEKTKKLKRMFKDIFNLAQTMVASIQKNQQNMILIFLQMLQGSKYVLGFQFLFN